MKHTLSALVFFSFPLLQPLYAQEPAAEANAYNYDEDYEEPEDKEYTPEEQAAALATLKDVHAKQLSIIQNVHNKETADAAVELLTEQSNRLTPELFSVLNSTDYTAIAVMHQSTANQFVSRSQELKKQFYFGSALLAKELAGSAAYTAPSTPMPEALKNELIAKKNNHTPQEEQAAGGPGFTKETAWKLNFPANEAPKDVVLHHIDTNLNLSSVVSQEGWDWSGPELTTVFADNKAYMLLKMDIINESGTPSTWHQLEQWFDLSAAYPFASESEWHAQLDRLIENLRTLQTALGKIQSKETAEAEAAHITTLLADIRAGYNAYYLLDDNSELYKQFHRKAVEQTRSMKAEIARIRKANHFGSPALKKVIKDNGKIVD